MKTLLLFCLSFLVLSLQSYAKIYVSNEKDNTISILDGKSYKLLKTVKVGQRPRGVILSKDQTQLYICASDDDRIEVLDLKTLKIVDILPSGPDPELMKISHDGKFIYVSNEDDNLITVVDIEKRKIKAEIQVGVEPEGIAISPDNKILVNTSETTNMAHFIDLENLDKKPYGNVLVESRPRYAEFSNDGKFVWVSSEIGGVVSVIDVKTLKIVKKISFAIPGVEKELIQPVGIAYSKKGLVFVALGPSNRLAVIDDKTFKVIKYILVGQRVWQLAFNKDETILVSTNGVSNNISVIDVKKLKAIKSITVGRYPWGVAYSDE